MGDRIIIGNAVPLFKAEDGLLFACWEVEIKNNDQAPKFPNDADIGGSNIRCLATDVWPRFSKNVALQAFFYDEDIGLMRERPGCFLLTAEHHASVMRALHTYKNKATLPPGFEEDQEMGAFFSINDIGKYDADFARLIWLEWWMNWALENCYTPAIENS